jgi:hypothetical protein
MPTLARLTVSIFAVGLLSAAAISPDQQAEACEEWSCRAQEFWVCSEEYPYGLDYCHWVLEDPEDPFSWHCELV